MIQVRRSEDRGHADHGWLDTRHTFSFAGYYDPRFRGFRDLLVINEDRVLGGYGFPTHGHRDMEILSYVLDGALEHKDSGGHVGVTRPGDVQRMTAGTGVYHSEYNASKTEELRFLQIWIQPEERGLSPSYEQRSFPEEERAGRLRVIASRDGRDDSVVIHQDATVYSTLLEPGQSVEVSLAPGRHAWVQVARGSVRLDDTQLDPGDGAAVTDTPSFTLTGADHAEVLVFDLQ